MGPRPTAVLPLPPLLPPQEGQRLSAAQPALGAMLAERLAELRRLWAELEETGRGKSRRLLGAGRAEACRRSCAELRAWLRGVRERLEAGEIGSDLSGVNRLLHKQQVGGRWGAEGRGMGEGRGAGKEQGSVDGLGATEGQQGAEGHGKGKGQGPATDVGQRRMWGRLR